MELGAAGLKQQPFRSHGKPLVFVRYAAQEAAFDFLRQISANETGLGLFQGPGLSGKTTIIREFAASTELNRSIAIVDGSGKNTTTFLEALLGQFGYDDRFNSVNELLAMLRVFLLQQTDTGHAPMLIVENTHEMNPSALRVLCELAELKVRRQSALRMVLASDRAIRPIIQAPAMESVATRLTGDFCLSSLTEYESKDYLYSKLRAGGCHDPARVLPDVVCEHLYCVSGGWPGVLDRLVLLAFARSEKCPISIQGIVAPRIPTGEPHAPRDDYKRIVPPRLFLTCNGNTLEEMDLESPRLIIGRSEHNDLSINSQFVSRHHAMFVRHGSATFLMDLNSTNGTFVNSRRISNQVMIHEDIVSFGNHRLKFIDPNAIDRLKLEGVSFSDTVIMKNLRDMRRVLARENTASLPIYSEEFSG